MISRFIVPAMFITGLVFLALVVGPRYMEFRSDRLMLDEALQTLRAVPRDASNVEILEAVLKVEAITRELDY